MAYDINFKKSCFANVKTSKIIEYLKTHIKRYERDTKPKKPSEVWEYKTDKVLLDYYLAGGKKK